MKLFGLLPASFFGRPTSRPRSESSVMVCGWVGKDFLNAELFQKGVSILRTKSRDNVGTVSTEGQTPHRPGRAIPLCGLITKFLTVKTKKFFCWRGGTAWLVRMLWACGLSRVHLFATSWTTARQAPPSMGFSRQEHWSGLPFPSPMHASKKWKWSRSVVSDS